MRNLLSAGFARLFKSKVLWLSCLFLAGTTVISIWTSYLDERQYGYHSSLDSAFIYYVLYIAFLIPALCTLFVGVEHADGTIRNKVVCGHGKVSLYLSNLVLTSTASLLMCTAAVVPGLCVGLPLLGKFQRGWQYMLLFFLAVYALALAWAALFTLLVMLVSNRTFSSVAALLLSLALLAAGMYLQGRLEARPTIVGYTLSVNGDIVEVETPNPDYLPEGPVREVFQVLSDFTPGGQTLQHVEMTADQPEKLAVYDLVFFLLVTGAGLILFKRKDLK